MENNALYETAKVFADTLKTRYPYLEEDSDACLALIIADSGNVFSGVSSITINEGTPEALPAEKIAASGVKYYIEVANMPTTNDALKYLMEQPNMVVAPSKAVNAGGVATSALEMSQNSERLVWTAEEVDARLHEIMNTIYQNSVDAAERNGFGYNLVAGANIAGFERVADAMLQQGVF